MLARKTKKTVSYPMRFVPLLLLSALSVLLSGGPMVAATVKITVPLDNVTSLVDFHDNERVLDYIDQFLRNAKGTEEILERGMLYFPIIEREIDIQGLPSALKILPVIESRCDPLAISKVGAVGLWQFMIPTARQLGLRINEFIDERHDPTKATRAALAYLKYLFEKYGDWTLALAAYNAGPGRVNKAIRQAGGIKTFDAVRPFLPRETQQYIPKYAALQYVVENHRKHGLSPDLPDLDLQWVGKVHLAREMDLKEVAKITNLDVRLLTFLNPALKKNYIPDIPLGYDLVIPQRVLPAFQYYLSTQEAFANSFSYRTLELTLDKQQSIHEIAANLSLDPYLIKYWNALNSEAVPAGHSIQIHELVNPQAQQVELIPERFKEVSMITPLPVGFDLEGTFAREYLRITAMQRESVLLDFQKQSADFLANN